MKMTTQIYVPTRSLGCGCISREAREAFADDCTLISDALDDDRAVLNGWREDAAEEQAVLLDREHLLQYDIDMEIEER